MHLKLRRSECRDDVLVTYLLLACVCVLYIITRDLTYASFPNPKRLFSVQTK